MKKKAKYTALNALKGLLREKGYTYRQMAETLGTAANTLSDKLNGFCLFDALEIDKMANILEVDPADIRKYFFPTLLRNATKGKSA